MNSHPSPRPMNPTRLSSSLAPLSISHGLLQPRLSSFATTAFVHAAYPTRFVLLLIQVPNVVVSSRCVSGLSAQPSTLPALLSASSFLLPNHNNVPQPQRDRLYAPRPTLPTPPSETHTAPLSVSPGRRTNADVRRGNAIHPLLCIMHRHSPLHELIHQLLSLSSYLPGPASKTSRFVATRLSLSPKSRVR